MSQVLYKAVFPKPGISDAANKDTKTAYTAVIAAYLKESDVVDRINLQATMGLDGDTSKDSVSAIQKSATLCFFCNSGEKEINPHYLESSITVIDRVIDVIE